MSWCDKLASTPTIGFRLTPHFAPMEAILNALSPILDRATEKEAKNTTLDQAQTYFSVTFTTNDGFKYAADESKISVAFSHRVKFRLESGGPPVMEMLSTPMPFTALIPVVEEKVIEAALLLPKAKDRLVQRVGVISTTALAEDDVPPGIKRLITYVGRPWSGSIESFNIAITAIISNSRGVTDRCIHTITKPEDKDQLLTLQFDWQRIFVKGWQNTKSNLERITEDAKKDALKYFEELAEGSRFDEILIRETASI